MIGEDIFVSSVFAAGVLSFFAPCILPLLPVYLGVLTGNDGGANESTRFNPIAVLKTVIFVAGLSTSFVILGFGAGLLGSFIFRREFYFILGLIVVLLGIAQTGLIKIKLLERQKKLTLKRSNKSDFLGTYLLGFTFSFGWTPCIGPVLAAVLAVSASKGQGLYGGWLMFIYSIGLMIPFLVISVFSEYLLGKVKGLYKHMGKIKIAGGILIIIMGLFLMTNNLNIITVFFEGLGR